jgi:hypothetical protein
MGTSAAEPRRAGAESACSPRSSRATAQRVPLIARSSPRRRSRRLRSAGVAIALACAFTAGCGDGDQGATAAENRDACAGYRGLATPESIAQSPFSNAEAEVLAIEASGDVVAPPSVYSRILHDLVAIRSASPAVADMHAMLRWSPRDVLVIFDAEGAAAVVAGTYTEWNCANALYGVSSVARHSESPQSTLANSFDLRFDHRFDAPSLAATYAALPHVVAAGADLFAGDGDDICVSMDGDSYSYIFDAGSGDCPAGCIEHTYSGFATAHAGADVVALGTWSNANGSAPPWFTALPDCTKWL